MDRRSGVDRTAERPWIVLVDDQESSERKKKNNKSDFGKCTCIRSLSGFGEVAETMDLMGSSWSAGKASQMLPSNMALTAPPKVDDWRVILKILWLGLKPGGLAATDARLQTVGCFA